MKMKDIIESMARMLGLDATELELGYDAFVNDFFKETLAC